MLHDLQPGSGAVRRAEYLTEQERVHDLQKDDYAGGRAASRKIEPVVRPPRAGLADKEIERDERKRDQGAEEQVLRHIPGRQRPVQKECRSESDHAALQTLQAHGKRFAAAGKEHTRGEHRHGDRPKTPSETNAAVVLKKSESACGVCIQLVE